MKGSDEDVEEAAKDHVFNIVSWSYEEVETAD